MIKDEVKYRFPETDAEIRKRIMVTSPFAHASVVYRKDAFNKVEILKSEDVES